MLTKDMWGFISQQEKGASNGMLQILKILKPRFYETLDIVWNKDIGPDLYHLYMMNTFITLQSWWECACATFSHLCSMVLKSQSVSASDSVF